MLLDTAIGIPKWATSGSTSGTLYLGLPILLQLR